MSKASANFVSFALAPETTWGETPGTPTLQQYLITASQLSHIKETVASASMRSDRQKTAQLQVGKSASGAVDFELTSALLDLLDGALCNAYTIVNKTQATLAGIATLTAKTIVFAQLSDYNTFANANLIKISGSASGNDGVYKIAMKDVGTKTLSIERESNFTSENTGANAALQLGIKYLRNGTTLKSYLVQIGFEDLVKYASFTGCRINQFSFNIASKQVVKAQMSLMAKTGLALANSSFTATAPVVENPATASVDVGTVTDKNGTAFGALASVTLAINNNLRERPVVGSQYSADHGVGEFAVTGQLNAYFEGASTYNDFFNHNDLSLQIPVTLGTKSVLLSLPRISLTTAPLAITGSNTDVQQAIDFQALRDADLGYTMQIDCP